MTPLEVMWHSPVYDPSGYAACARDYILSLDKNGVRVLNKPVSFWSNITQPAVSGDTLDRLKALEASQISPTAPRVQHYVPDVYKRGRDARPQIGYTVFETDGCPEKWLKKMDMMDQIWVPCHFNLDTFENSGFDRKKMRVIPHIVDTDLFNPDVTPLDIPIKKDFYFLVVMDVTHRKGWDILLRSYLREFKGNRDVGLVFKGYFGGVGEQQKRNLINKLRAFRDSLNIHNPPDIIFFGDIMDQIDMPRLYKACQCFVLPHRGEGWGLTLSQAMSMGMPTIGTGWSGNLEFMNKDNSYLIDVLEFREINDEMVKITPNYNGQKWAEPSELHLRSLMRTVYDNYEDAKKKGIQARQDMVNNFTWKPITDKIKEALGELL